jgi:membrane-bound lytic murein transglycosylase D
MKGIENALSSLRRSHNATKKRINAVNLKVDRLQKKEAPAPTKTKSRTHTVRKGDTFYSISKKYGVTIDDLLKRNKMKKGQELKIGQKVLIP